MNKRVNPGLHFLNEWAAKDPHKHVRTGCEVVLNGRLIDIDAVITYESTPIAVVAIAETNNVDTNKRFIGELLRVGKYPVGIVSLDSKFWARTLGTERFVEKSREQVLELIEKSILNYQNPVSSEDAKNKLIGIFESSKDFKTKSTLKPIFQKACNSLIIQGGRVSFREQDENAVMHAILGSTENTTHICRYTSFENLFKMLNNMNVTMCCVRSMNDPNEGNYADSFIIPRTKYIPRTESDIEMENSCFMLSCSPEQMSDNLTMFRLYGDNAKGVCEVYAVDHNRIDDHRFFFAPVSYGKSENEHPELELLSALQNTAIRNGWFFILNRWYVWRYFFKSFSYNVEKEIRLIYFPDMDTDDDVSFIWYKDNNNSIINRFASFPMRLSDNSSFPFLLSSVIIGPICPEQKANIEQVQYMVELCGYNTAHPFSVVRSKHKNYR